MKALSVHQPFAGLIASGEKTIETRRWPTSYRGDLYDGAWSWFLGGVRPIKPFQVRGYQRIYEVEVPEGVLCES